MANRQGAGSELIIDAMRHNQSVVCDVVKKGKCNGPQWSRLTANNESTNVPPAVHVG